MLLFFSHVPRITQPKNLVPRSKGVPCSPFTHIDRVTTEGTLSGFQGFFLPPIIKDHNITIVFFYTFTVQCVQIKAPVFKPRL